MPTIAYFYGIAIRMYLREHPPPQFHAIYAEHDATVDILTGEIMDGWLPRTAARLVKEWTLAQRDGCSTIGRGSNAASHCVVFRALLRIDSCW